MEPFTIGIFGGLGYLFGQSLPLLVKWVGWSGTLLLILALVIAFVTWRIYRHKARVAESGDPEI